MVLHRWLSELVVIKWWLLAEEIGAQQDLCETSASGMQTHWVEVPCAFQDFLEEAVHCPYDDLVSRGDDWQCPNLQGGEEVQGIQEAREMHPAALLVMKLGSANYKLASSFLDIALCVCYGVALFVFCILCWLLLCASC